MANAPAPIDTTPSDASVSDGICWFCRSRVGGMQSVALPFWSNVDDEVRVLVLPRCASCAEFHQRQRIPSGLIMVGAAMLAGVLASLLPLSEGWRTPVNVAAILSGFLAGLVFTANREARQAKARGTRPLPDYVQHPPYHRLASDTARWRQARGPGISDGSGTRQESVQDYKRYFLGVLKDATAFAALQRGCRDAGIPLPDGEKGDGGN